MLGFRNIQEKLEKGFIPYILYWDNKKSQRYALFKLFRYCDSLEKKERHLNFAQKHDFFQVKHLFDLQSLSLVFYPLDILEPNT